MRSGSAPRRRWYTVGEAIGGNGGAYPCRRCPLGPSPCSSPTSKARHGCSAGWASGMPRCCATTTGCCASPSAPGTGWRSTTRATASSSPSPPPATRWRPPSTPSAPSRTTPGPTAWQQLLVGVSPTGQARAESVPGTVGTAHPGPVGADRRDVLSALAGLRLLPAPHPPPSGRRRRSCRPACRFPVHHAPSIGSAGGRGTRRAGRRSACQAAEGAAWSPRCR